MPQAEVPGAKVGGAATRTEPQELDFSKEASKRIEDAVSDYHTNLRRTAQVCCNHDDCDQIQLKHVRQAEDVVCRMGPTPSSLGVNPHIWTLLAAVSFAIAIAIPDAGTMILGNPENGGLCWTCLKAAFWILLPAGVTFSVISFMIALGPHQPKWFIALKTALASIAKRRK